MRPCAKFKRDIFHIFDLLNSIYFNIEVASKSEENQRFRNHFGCCLIAEELVKYILNIFLPKKISIKIAQKMLAYETQRKRNHSVTSTTHILFSNHKISLPENTLSVDREDLWRNYNSLPWIALDFVWNNLHLRTVLYFDSI